MGASLAEFETPDTNSRVACRLDQIHSRLQHPPHHRLPSSSDETVTSHIALHGSVALAPFSRPRLPLPTAKMRTPLLLLSLVGLLSTFVTSTVLTYKMAANEKECFYTHIDKRDAKIGFYFAVQSGGSFDSKRHPMYPCWLLRFRAARRIRKS